MTSTLRLLMFALLASAAAAAEPAPEPPPPAIAAKLLFASRLGGVGDQWFSSVGIRGAKVAAGNKDGLRLVVTVADDDSVSAVVGGDRALASRDIPAALPNGGKLGAYSFGYRQVAPDLQQPFLEGPGWKLWDWTVDQARAAKGPFAPYNADSRIRAVHRLPDGNLAVVGSTDGGNTVFQALPTDLDHAYPHGITPSMSGGFMCWTWRISPRGEALGAMAVRGPVHAVAQDRWGRVLVAGRAIIGGGKGSIFGASDGAGLLMVDREWKQMLLAAHFGRTVDEGGGAEAWGVTIDSDRGLAAVCGWTSYPTFNDLAPIQTAPGGGKDAFLAVFRLWTMPAKP